MAHCYPLYQLDWTIADSDLLFTIATDSTARRDVVLRAYLNALTNAPPMRDLAPTPTPRPTLDPVQAATA